MIEEYRLSKLPRYGKIFIAAFAIMIIGVVLWMFVLGGLESGMVGNGDATVEEIAEEAVTDLGTIEEEEAMEPLIEDSELVTPPDWSDSGEQKVITEADEEKFADVGDTAPAISFWEKFEENMEISMEHFSSEVLLFFAVGMVFLFTGYGGATKRFFYIFLAVLIVLHAFGVAGYGFCWPADIIMYVIGPIILLTLLVIAVMILKDLGRK